MNYTIPLGRAGKYGHLPVDTDRFTDAVREHVFLYGLRQALNDAMADKTDEDGQPLPIDQIAAKAQKRLDTFYAGEIRTRGESPEPIDPVEAEAWKMAKENMIAAYKTIGAWDVPKGTKDRFAFVIARRRAERKLPELEPADAVRDAIEKFLAAPANAHIRKAATRIVQEREKAASAVNVDELIM